jgi:glycosyltransferase involved in cell wall biosynthesis
VTTIWDLQHRLQPFFPEVSQSGEWEAREQLFTTATRKASLCIVGTNRGKSELQQFYGIDDSRILVNPFPCPQAEAPILDEATEQSRQPPAGTLGAYLLYPAQFWSHKNHIGALYALRELANRTINLRLVLTGSDKGALASVNTLAKQLGVSDLVVNLGFVSREALAELYRGCFALLFPSYFGPDNIPPLEAMSYRAPVIVADVLGAREQYGDSALYFDPTDYTSMADAVQMLVEVPDLRAKLVLRGSELVSRLTPSIYVDNVEKAIIANALPLLCASAMHRQ